MSGSKTTKYNQTISGNFDPKSLGKKSSAPILDAWQRQAFQKNEAFWKCRRLPRKASRAAVEAM